MTHRRNTRGLLPMKALAAGEGTRVYRVRAPVEVHDWLNGMTAEERGAMLAQVHAIREELPSQPGVK